MATPTALVFNDTHAMDDASVALIRQLCSDVPARPWSIVLSRRPDGSTEATFPNATAMALDALTLDDADALVVAASTIRIPAPRRAELSERSGGNPLFLRALAETVAAGGDPDALPSEIEDVLTAHMDRLSPDERAWLRTAAVLGIRVDPELLDEILDDPFDPSGSPRLLEYIRPDADGTLVFAHHLIQRTAYEALPFRRRRTLHARASYFIERQAGDNLADVADVLAIHCLRGQRFDAAWQYARMAGRRASDRYAPMEAATLFDIALDAATSIPGLPAGEVADAAEALAEARSVLGDPELTEQALKLARRHARRDPRRLGRISLLTASQRYRSGRYDDALRWVRRGRALLDRSDPADLRLLAELAELAGVVHHSRGSVAHAYRWAEIAAGEAQQCGDRQRAASALSQLALAKSQTGESWSAVDLSGSEDWNLATYAEILNRLGVAAYYQGDRSAAFDFYAEAEACGRRAGREARAATYAANRAEVLVDDGRFADAIPPLEAAIEQFRSTHAVAYLPFALALLGRAVEGTQGRGAATPYFEESLRFAVESADAEAQAEAKRLLGIT
jgi:predicted ATPase